MPNTVWEATCDWCRKRIYRSGREARRMAKRIPGGHLTAYRCPKGHGWHLGHLPERIKLGLADKHAYEAGARARLARQRAAEVDR